MTFDVKENSARFEASIEDLKLVYRVLHRHLGENLDLMECDFFDALQSALQQKAQGEGVDIGHHRRLGPLAGQRERHPLRGAGQEAEETGGIASPGPAFVITRTLPPMTSARAAALVRLHAKSSRKAEIARAMTGNITNP